MTGRIELTWRPRVVADEIRVYRALAPMDPAALPSPIATLGAAETRYTDSSVVAGEGYYYRVASVLTASPETVAVSAELYVEAAGGGGSGSGSGSP